MGWQRILVPASTTLRELHGILQVAMGWEGIHLFLFDVHAAKYGSFDLHASSPDIALQTFEFRENERFSYVYDMGDHWKHEIRIEKIGTQAENKPYPNCTGGSGAGPPEDCGGPHAYLERRDEAGGYDAWRDMNIMADFLKDIAGANTPDRPVSDFLSDDVEAAIERMVARAPFIEGTFSRRQVNKRFRSGDHQQLMHQQMW